MTVALRKLLEHTRTQVVTRRIAADTKGLGYWAAMDYLEAKKRQAVGARLMTKKKQDDARTPEIKAEVGND